MLELQIMSQADAKLQKRGARPLEADIYREFDAGGFSRKDCTVAFYTRIGALIDSSMTLLNLGAGRGANILADYSPYRRKIQTFNGQVARVIGADIDPAILENHDIDQALLISPSGILEIPNNTVDAIISDHVLEHVGNPDLFAAEVLRVLKPGGWFCARTPSKWGYIGLSARFIPNVFHVKLLTHLQPNRKPEDVFPTLYKLNTWRAINRHFPKGNWDNFSYGYSGTPGYHANSRILFRAIDLYNRFMPEWLSAKYHIFLRKKA